ncbi:hypothetical protein I79_018267 [Cricetulus griseus]|uniref:Uncharacterized protein n=1 Tax=Cricetulus griseus TaxID=10029 RepID=G3I490_CRIGR|nr:hypothetical protein I79_018267 [Cricetulus griseus]
MGFWRTGQYFMSVFWRLVDNAYNSIRVFPPFGLGSATLLCSCWPLSTHRNQ